VSYNPRTLRVISGPVHIDSRSDVTDEKLFLSSLPVINDVVAQVCRRHRFSANEAEEFAAELRLHLIERNYERLRKFDGRCSLRTYLTAVVQNYLYDYRDRLWGKWRPSAQARRLGPTGILLERLVIRDGWTMSQAIEILQTNHGVTLDAKLEALAVRIAARQPGRQIVSERAADGMDSPASPSDVNVVRVEQEFLAKRVYAALDRARQALVPEERLILKMRFDDGMAVADIARALDVNQKRLYRTIERLLAVLRARLEAEGMSKDDIRALFAEIMESAGDPDESTSGAGRAAAS